MSESEWVSSHQIAKLTKPEGLTRNQSWGSLTRAEKKGLIERRPSTGESRYEWRVVPAKANGRGLLSILLDLG